MMANVRLVPGVRPPMLGTVTEMSALVPLAEVEAITESALKVTAVRLRLPPDVEPV